MAKRTNEIDLNSIDDSDRAAAKKFRKNEEIDLKAKKMEALLAKHFCFDEHEIKNVIDFICSFNDTHALEEFSNIIKSFADNDTSSFTPKERKTIAKRVLNDYIELYFSNTASINQEFFDVLSIARTLKIDPFRFAIKTNIKNLTMSRFEKSLDALMGSYKNIKSGKEAVLFTSDEVSALLNKCSTAALNLSEQNIQNILNLLNDFSFDSKTNSFVFDAKELLKKVPSLLTVPAKNMKETIDLLVDMFAKNGGKAQLALRIYQSPSILGVKGETIIGVEDSLLRSATKVFKQIPSDKKYEKPEEITKQYIYDLNHLTQIDKLKSENFSTLADVLVKYVGAENAYQCLTNSTILAEEPSFLEGFLAILTQKEQTSNLKLREMFVKSPHRLLSKITEITNDNFDENSTQETGRTHGAFKPTIQNMPNISQTEQEVNALYKKVSSNKTLLNALVKQAEEMAAEKARQEEEEKRRKEEEEAERRRQRNEERKRKQEEQREKNRESKKIWKDGEKDKKLVDGEGPQPDVDAIMEAKAEWQANNVKKLKDIEPIDTEKVALRDFFQMIVSPIYKFLKDCKQYQFLRSLPDFDIANKAYIKYCDGMTQTVGNYTERIIPLAAMCHELKGKSTLQKIHYFAKTDEKGLKNIRKIAILLAEAQKNLYIGEGKIRSAAASLQSTGKLYFSNGDVKDCGTLSTAILMADFITSYTQELLDKVNALVGDDAFAQFISRNPQILDLLDLFKEENVSPFCYNSLIVTAYVLPIMADTLTELNDVIQHDIDDYTRSIAGDESIKKLQSAGFASKMKEKPSYDRVRNILGENNISSNDVHFFFETYNAMLEDGFESKKMEVLTQNSIFDFDPVKQEMYVVPGLYDLDKNTGEKILLRYIIPSDCPYFIPDPDSEYINVELDQDNCKYRNIIISGTSRQMATNKFE